MSGTSVVLKPWMEVIPDKGIVLCMMCPTGKVGKHGEQYYLALRTKRAKRVTQVNWMRTHRRCGFEGLM